MNSRRDSLPRAARRARLCRPGHRRSRPLDGRRPTAQLDDLNRQAAHLLVATDAPLARRGRWTVALARQGQRDDGQMAEGRPRAGRARRGRVYRDPAAHARAAQVALVDNAQAARVAPADHAQAGRIGQAAASAAPHVRRRKTIHADLFARPIRQGGGA